LHKDQDLNNFFKDINIIYPSHLKIFEINSLSTLTVALIFYLCRMNSNALAYEDHVKQRRYDVAYLKMAIEWAKLSHCTRKQVGAIIVKNGMIISDGYNGTPSGFDNCCENKNNETHWYVLHAEANAILKLAKSTNSGEGATLYITLSPCKDCSKLILQSGIKRVVYMNAYKDDEGIAFLSKSDIQITHLPVLENE
jgi:dCMP deaminase